MGLDDVGVQDLEPFVNDLDDVLGLEEEFVVGIPTAQEISAVSFRCNQDLDTVGDPTFLANDVGAWMAPHGGHCNEDFFKAATLLNCKIADTWGHTVSVGGSALPKGTEPRTRLTSSLQRYCFGRPQSRSLRIGRVASDWATTVGLHWHCFGDAQDNGIDSDIKYLQHCRSLGSKRPSEACSVNTRRCDFSHSYMTSNVLLLKVFGFCLNGHAAIALAVIAA